jgi:hypothetical protein
MLENIPFTNKYKYKDYTFIKIINNKKYHICVNKTSEPGESNNKCHVKIKKQSK